MSDLLHCVKKTNVLSKEGSVKALVLAGMGSHFCTGGISIDTKGERSHPRLEILSQIVITMRKLPIPTLAIIHGKVIGGGLALSLAADWRVCTAKTTPNCGNLPRGMSCIMNLSLALPLTVGRAFANQVYLEDTVLNSTDATKFGLVNHVEPSKQDAEIYAHRIAESLVLSQQFEHGPVSYICGENASHIS